MQMSMEILLPLIQSSVSNIFPRLIHNKMKCPTTKEKENLKNEYIRKQGKENMEINME
jgi:hypothetical protein